jgi:hypothetical protein
MAHPFLAGVDFDKLLLREVQPPLVPKIASTTDVSNFEVDESKAVDFSADSEYVADVLAWDRAF